MKQDNLYQQIHSMKNLFFAFKKARKGKTKKYYVKRFEKCLIKQLLTLSIELKSQKYSPEPLRTFILRDPKTRKISKSTFRDRVVHHAIVRIMDPIFDKNFIYDSCANRKGKGNLFALKRFDLFKRKITNNLNSKAFCLKADIKHYFQEVNHKILLTAIERKIKDEKVMWLIKQILGGGEQGKGMPLGNLTSQFFANIYLNELDRFIKYELKAEYYIRYVDDFVILHSSKEQLEIWKNEIDNFLKEKLKLELHPDKSKLIPLSRGIDFVGFRNFCHYRLLRKRNIKKMYLMIKKYKRKEISKDKLFESFQGWQAYAKWADSYKLRYKVKCKIESME